MEKEREWVSRTSSVRVDEMFLKRWSPRAFDASPLRYENLLRVLEAARWAPSAFNIQPWRFLYSLRHDSHWPLFLDLLDSFNRQWACRASALVFLLSDQLCGEAMEAKPNPSHSFDTGAAWAQLSLQANKLGLHTRAMAGIHHQRIRQQLGVPERYAVEIGIAIGRRASSEVLPENLRRKEKPNHRLPLQHLVFAGHFPRQMNDDGLKAPGRFVRGSDA